MEKEEFKLIIDSHIKNLGYHVTTVAGKSALPRYSYSIGLEDTVGFELVFAGGEIFNLKEVSEIIKNIIEKLKIDSDWENKTFRLEDLKSYTLSKVNESWISLMLDGIVDYYKGKKIIVLQIIPDQKNKTLDVPDMSIEFNAERNKIWQWLINEWTYPIAEGTLVFTNTEALFGEKITELMRWEEDEWEMFTENSDEIDKANIKIVPFGVLLGIDATLIEALNVKVGKGLWREDDSLEWNAWG
ncbi:DUF4262 domain-containing protein [Flavobacterium hydatis]|uniref:DUF4262 domain-containing protein n=1 Tax=Flavobacterium hydatis TaxID=991 RepID=A0A086AAP6_FLAHY|nr:DUF4262 domain-containing protein [Flavobacterium hydatis]KFF13760.1 hypothetical protein IW20_16895 [Flavobacterium hydatis]OXA97797.1 DUF4262 domain-containing protein [Flavobacterium hydatis]